RRKSRCQGSRQTCEDRKTAASPACFPGTPGTSDGCDAGSYRAGPRRRFEGATPPDVVAAISGRPDHARRISHATLKNPGRTLSNRFFKKPADSTSAGFFVHLETVLAGKNSTLSAMKWGRGWGEVVLS